MYITHFVYSFIIYIAYTSLLFLWIRLQWTWVYKNLFETLLSGLLDIYLEVELLGYMVILVFNFSRKHHFPQWLYPFQTLPIMNRVLIFPYPQQHLLHSVFLNSGHSNVCDSYTHGWYLTVILIRISLMIDNVGDLFICSLIIFISSLEKWWFKSLLTFDSSCFFFLFHCCCWVLGVLHIFWIFILYKIDDLQVFSLILWVSLSLSWLFLLLYFLAYILKLTNS